MIFLSIVKVIDEYRPMLPILLTTYSVLQCSDQLLEVLPLAIF